MLTIALLCCFAFAAGFVDAMVGGGGLIQLPAYFVLMPQLSLLQTLATNKTSSFFGTFVAAVSYTKKVDTNWRKLVPTIASALVGAVSGAFIVSFVKKEDFMPFIICVLLIMLVYTLLKKNLGLHQKLKQLSPTRYYVSAIGMGLVVGLYDGIIGPATGSFMIFLFIMLFGYDFLHASAHTKILNCATNIAALSFFFIRGAIMWHIALPVGAANMAGNYLGSHVAIKKGSAFIRVFFIIIVLALIIKLGYDYL